MEEEINCILTVRSFQTTKQAHPTWVYLITRKLNTKIFFVK